MRRRTITLVVVGLVMALFVLPAAAEIMLGDEADAETEELAAEEESFFFYDESTHVVTYAPPSEDPEVPECAVTEGDIEVVVEGDEVTINGVPEGCEGVFIEGPNGQVNHGTFVSAMVHDLKADYNRELHGPFGQWVKEFAQDDEIGKGDLKVPASGDDDVDDGDDPTAASTDADTPKPNKGNNGKKKNG